MLMKMEKNKILKDKSYRIHKEIGDSWMTTDWKNNLEKPWKKTGGSKFKYKVQVHRSKDKVQGSTFN